MSNHDWVQVLGGAIAGAIVLIVIKVNSKERK